MTNGWAKIIHYRRIYWLLFFLIIPVLLLVDFLFKNEFLIGIVFATYAVLVGVYLKKFLFAQTCPNCRKKFFPAWGDLLFSKCNSCGCKVGESTSNAK